MSREADNRNSSSLTPIKQALLEIRDLRARLEQRERDPIAIIGMGMRFPGGICDSSSFWELMQTRTDAIGKVPSDRWLPLVSRDGQVQQTNEGGFLDHVYDFDADFFHISPREAESLDPQHRLLLEVVWTTLENGGVPPDSLAHTQTGIFVGLSNSDYARKLLSDGRSIDAQASINALSLAAGRIAYLLNTHGPAVVVDTSCSSSLSALHLACQSLRAQECSVAIVGGVNLILSPEINVAFSRSGMLSPDGRCKTFDDAANGYVRSEGCASILLKPLKRAIEDRDRVLAIIRGSAINHDGRSAGLTAPNGPAQEAVIREALSNANVTASSIDYVEAHGTGTALGDPIEVEALARAYGNDRSRALHIGSVKTNLGHLEAAAGLAGLLKVLLALEHEKLPAQLHFENGNKHLNWAELPLSVVSSAIPWRRTDLPRRAGLSSFGFSGTNAHVILEEPPLVRKPDSGTSPVRPVYLLCLSTSSEPALRDLVSQYRKVLPSATAEFADVCFTANAGRSHYEHRLSLAAHSREEAVERLTQWETTGAAGAVVSGRIPDRKAPVAFVYPELNGYERDAVRTIYEQFPAFREAFANCEVVCEQLHGVSLHTLLYKEPDGPLAARCFEFSAAYSLSRLWIALGVEPAIVLGEKTGELVAVAISGVLSLNDAMRMVVESETGFPVDTFSSPKITVVSSMTGRVENDLLCTADYWSRQFRSAQSGKFAEGLATIVRRANHLFLGVGPDLRDTALRSGIRPGQLVCLSFSTNDGGQQILAALQSLYCSGQRINWKELDRGQVRTKVDLPTYPFQRRTYRFGKTPAEEYAQRSEAIWNLAAKAALNQSESAPLGWDIRQYDAKWRSLQSLTLAHIRQALFLGGVFHGHGDVETLDSILKHCGFLEAHRSLIGRWLKQLVDSRFLRYDDPRFTCLIALGPLDLESYWKDTEAAFVNDPAVLQYLRQCASLLIEVLQGRKSALETLFPDGSFSFAEGIYESSPQAGYFNSIVAAAINQAESASQGIDLRVLEIGAGTGGTTSAVLRQLNADTTEYWFTDLSDLFLTRAQKKFRDFRFVRYARFDLETPLEPQGFAPHSFDIVVAANVVHASRNVRQSVRTIAELLAPGGLVVLLESTNHFPWFDITTGLIEGWGLFEDDIRVDNPLLRAQQWVDLLNESGFELAQQFPKPDSLAEVVGEHVILARIPISPLGAGLSQVNTAAFKSIRVSEQQDSPFDDLLVALRNARSCDRFELMFDYVRTCLRQVFHLDPEYALGTRDRFSDLGMDSLLALELRAALSKQLPVESMPASLAFDTGTPGSLTEALLSMLFPVAAQDKFANGRQAEQATHSADEIEKLSEEEVEELLLQRLQVRGKN